MWKYVDSVIHGCRNQQCPEMGPDDEECCAKPDLGLRSHRLLLLLLQGSRIVTGWLLAWSQLLPVQNPILLMFVQGHIVDDLQPTHALMQ